MEEMFSCCLEGSLSSQSQPRVELDLHFSPQCVPHSLARSARADTPSLYLGFGRKIGFMPPASPGTLGKDGADGCESAECWKVADG